MKLIVGLGNPGQKYERNRHNVGFMAVDKLAEEFGFAPFRNRFKGLVSEGRIGTERALILKPQTYMNESGQSVGEAARFLKVDEADVIVLLAHEGLGTSDCSQLTGDSVFAKLARGASPEIDSTSSPRWS